MKNYLMFLLLLAVLFSVFAEGEKIVKCDNCPKSTWLIVKSWSENTETANCSTITVFSANNKSVEILPSGKLAKVITIDTIIKQMGPMERAYGDAMAIRVALNGGPELVKKKAVFLKKILWPQKIITETRLVREENNFGTIVKAKQKEKKFFSWEIFSFLLGIILAGVLGMFFLKEKDKIGGRSFWLPVLAAMVAFTPVRQIFSASTIHGSLVGALASNTFYLVISFLASCAIFCVIAVASLSVQLLFEKNAENRAEEKPSKLLKITEKISAGVTFVILSSVLASLFLGKAAGNLLFWTLTSLVICVMSFSVSTAIWRLRRKK